MILRAGVGMISIFTQVCQGVLSQTAQNLLNGGLMEVAER